MTICCCKLRGELGVAQPGPAGSHARHQGVHEMLDAALAAAEMPQQVGAHDAPAQSRAPRHCVVGVGDVEHALADQVDNLAVERRLEAVGHVPGQLLLQMNRLLSDRGVERHRVSDRLRGGRRPTDDLHEGNDMRRIERVADHGPLRTPALGLHHAHRDAGRARGDDRVRRRGIVDVGEQLDLEFRTLRRVLLNEIGVGQRGRHVGRELQSINRGAGCESQCRRAFPCTFDVGPQRRLGAWRRVGGGDVEAAGEIVRRPTRTDGAGTDDGDALHIFLRKHLQLLCFRLFVSVRARRVRVSRRKPVRPRARPRCQQAVMRPRIGA